jgi:hypothetical protein
LNPSLTHVNNIGWVTGPHASFFRERRQGLSQFPQKTTRGFKPDEQIRRDSLRSPRSGRFFCRCFGAREPAPVAGLRD